jgi:hypothetical protein
MSLLAATETNSAEKSCAASFHSHVKGVPGAMHGFELLLNITVLALQGLSARVSGKG